MKQLTAQIFEIKAGQHTFALIKLKMNDRMKEVNPEETTRAYAFEMWMNAPMPMLTFFKTIDVTRIVCISKRTGLKFNMLMCWCIGQAASNIKEFYMLPVGRKLILMPSIQQKKGDPSNGSLPFYK